MGIPRDCKAVASNDNAVPADGRPMPVSGNSISLSDIAIPHNNNPIPANDNSIPLGGNRIPAKGSGILVTCREAGAKKRTARRSWPETWGIWRDDAPWPAETGPAGAIPASWRSPAFSGKNRNNRTNSRQQEISEPTLGAAASRAAWIGRNSVRRQLVFNLRYSPRSASERSRSSADCARSAPGARLRQGRACSRSRGLTGPHPLSGCADSGCTRSAHPSRRG